MTTGNNLEWRLKRVEEMLASQDVWEKWHQKQLIRALAEAAVPVLGSMGLAMKSARYYVTVDHRSVYGGDIDYSDCIDPENFNALVEAERPRFLWTITPR